MKKQLTTPATPQTVSNSVEGENDIANEFKSVLKEFYYEGLQRNTEDVIVKMSEDDELYFEQCFNESEAVNNYQRLLDSNAELLEALELVLNSLDTFGESNSWEMTDTIAWTKGNEILKKYKP